MSTASVLLGKQGMQTLVNKVSLVSYSAQLFIKNLAPGDIRSGVTSAICDAFVKGCGTLTVQR